MASSWSATINITLNNNKSHSYVDSLKIDEI